MKCKIFMGLAWTFLLNVCLPTVDVISDVYFTWDVYSRDQMNYFITSGEYLFLQLTTKNPGSLILSMYKDC